MKKVAKMEAFLCPLSLKRLHYKKRPNVNLDDNNNNLSNSTDINSSNNCFSGFVNFNHAATDDNNNNNSNAISRMIGDARYPFDPSPSGHEYNNDLISISTENSSAPNSPKNGPILAKMVMLNDFYGQGDNQVALKCGDIVCVLYSDPHRPEWTAVTFNKRRQEGFVPTIFLKPLLTEEEDTNVRLKQHNNKPTISNNNEHHHQPNMKNELREIASKLNLTSGKHKKSATVRPISAQDQQTIDSAISLAHELASKSMLELGDSSSNHDDSPRTPTSPDKKKTFHFRFKNLCRNFSEAAANIPDVQSSITKEAELAYNSLIEKGMLHNKSTKQSVPHTSVPETRYTNIVDCPDLMDVNPIQMQPTTSTGTIPTVYYNEINHNINILPLPPRPQVINKLQAPPTKQHRRKHPTVLPGYKPDISMHNSNHPDL